MDTTLCTCGMGTQGDHKGNMLGASQHPATRVDPRCADAVRQQNRRAAPNNRRPGSRVAANEVGGHYRGAYLGGWHLALIHNGKKHPQPDGPETGHRISEREGPSHHARGSPARHPCSQHWTRGPGHLAEDGAEGHHNPRERQPKSEGGPSGRDQ